MASRLTGISPDKLRMWERRYGFPKPARTDTGIRTYSEEEVERLVLVARAMQAGYRAREAVAKKPEELRQFLAESAKPATTFGPLLDVDGFIDTIRSDDPAGLRNELRQAVATLGPKRFVTQVAAPLVERVGDAWHAGKIGVRHEHLFSEALRAQIRLLLSAYEEPRDGPIILLSTLAGEQHGLGLDMAALYLALDGAIIRLLGVDTPHDQIVQAALALEADVVGISMSASADVARASELVTWMLAQLPQAVAIWVGGKSARSLSLDDPRLKYTVTWAELDRAMSELVLRMRASH